MGVEEKDVKYDVILVQPVMVKVKGIRAKSYQDAIKKAHQKAGPDIRGLLDTDGTDTIAYTEIEENGYLYYLVDQYCGEKFGDNPKDENNTKFLGPDGFTVLDWNQKVGIDDPLGEWRRNHDQSDPFGIDRVQFARLLYELAGIGLTKKQMKYLRESADLDDIAVAEILTRSMEAHERDKKEFCQAPTAAFEESMECNSPQCAGLDPDCPECDCREGNTQVKEENNLTHYTCAKCGFPFHVHKQGGKI